MHYWWWIGKTTDQYAEGKRWVFSFDLKEESEDEWQRKGVPEHTSVCGVYSFYVCVCVYAGVSCVCVWYVYWLLCVISTCRAIQCDTGWVSLQRSAKPAYHTTPCNCELFPALPFLFSFIRGTYARWANSPQSHLSSKQWQHWKNQHCMNCICRAIQLV